MKHNRLPAVTELIKFYLISISKLALTFFSFYFSCSQEHSGVVVDLLRHFHHLKLIVCTVVENAQAVAHNLPDHNHNALEARKTFTRVRT